MSYKLFARDNQLPKIKKMWGDRDDIEIVDVDIITNVPRQVRGCPTLWAEKSLFEGFQAIDAFLESHMQNRIAPGNRHEFKEQGLLKNDMSVHAPSTSNSIVQQPILNDKQPIDMSKVESLRSRYTESTLIQTPMT